VDYTDSWHAWLLNALIMEEKSVDDVCLHFAVTKEEVQQILIQEIKRLRDLALLHNIPMLGVN
jgi:dsDNA-binding SOS-regulon protein